jgi:hypothetical protein
MTDIDFKIPEFEIDITDEVKHLHDEHPRLAENYRRRADSYTEQVSEARLNGDLKEFEDAVIEQDIADERADLHEHTANVLALILGLGNEDG